MEKEAREDVSELCLMHEAPRLGKHFRGSLHYAHVLKRCTCTVTNRDNKDVTAAEEMIMALIELIVQPRVHFTLHTNTHTHTHTKVNNILYLNICSNRANKRKIRSLNAL